MLKIKLVDYEIKACENINIMTIFQEIKKTITSIYKCNQRTIIELSLFEGVRSKKGQSKISEKWAKKVKLFQIEYHLFTSLFTQEKKERKKSFKSGSIIYTITSL